jgi:hypothetical protein
VIPFALRGFVCLVVLLAGLGCGRKGPPIWKSEPFPLRVERFVVEVRAGRAELQGEIVAPGGETERLKDAVALRVYHTWYPADAPPCDGCPIDYPGYETHAIPGLERGRFLLEVPLKRKGIHYLELRAMGRRGEAGPISNRVKVQVD